MLNLSHCFLSIIPFFKCDLLPQKLPPPDYVNILIMINRSCVKLKLQTGDIFLHKILELYEMIIVRHGLMLVGYSFGAKSCAYRVLADALSDLFREGLNNENITRYIHTNVVSIISFI
jgi:dynein heavy chain